MPFARTSFLRSFRFRVMFAMFSVVVGTMLLTNVLVRAVVKPSILLEFDQQLADEARDTVAEIRSRFHGNFPADLKLSPDDDDLILSLERRAKSRGNLKWFIRLYDADKK